MADPVAEVLAEHGLIRFGVECAWCRCGEQVYNDDGSHLLTFAAHQADALRAKGLVASEVEWGIELPWGRIDIPYTEAKAKARHAELIDGSRLMTRGVTPWRTADEGSE